MAVATSGRPARSGNSVAGHRHDALNVASQNLANLLTLTRLICALPLPFLIIGGWHGTAFGLFLFAAVTDIADGYVAKRFNGCSPLGAVLDPAADKILLGLGFISLAAIGSVEIWVTLLVVGRDLLLVGGALLMRRRVRSFRIEPLVVGKLCTFAQLILIGLLLASLVGLIDMAPWLVRAEIVVAAITIASALAYLVSALRLVIPAGRATQPE